MKRNVNGGEVSVVVGQTFGLALPENAMTGYHWLFRASGSPCVEVRLDSYQAPDAFPKVGGGGKRRWHLQGVAAGTVGLQLDYQREWEQRAVESFSVTIRVEP